jgi:hypothetical protein
MTDTNQKENEMTLENATQNLWKAHCNFDDPRKAMDIVIDQIYNDYDATIKAKDNEIKKLKEQYHQCLDDYIKCAERTNQ